MARSGRGGPRQGTPGVSYSNRSDLNQNRAPVTGTATPAAGGQRPAPASAASPQSWITPDAVVPLDAPSARPDEPVTAGLPMGAGQGPEALGMMPYDPTVATVQAAYLRNPTPQLRRALYLLMQQGAL